MRFVFEAPSFHDAQSVAQHRHRRPQEQDAIVSRDARDVTLDDDTGGAGRVVIVSGTIHAGVAAVRLEAPFWVGENYAVALHRQCRLRGCELARGVGMRSIPLHSCDALTPNLSLS